MLLSELTILTGYLNKIVSSNNGLTVIFPMDSEYLKPRAFGINKPKIKIRNESIISAENRASKFEY